MLHQSHRYANQCGVVVAVLIGLTATKIITEKRNEFFREAGSGYNINAHFCAINVIATLEHGLQVMLASMFALWLRNSVSSWYMVRNVIFVARKAMFVRCL